MTIPSSAMDGWSRVTRWARCMAAGRGRISGWLALGAIMVLSGCMGDDDQPSLDQRYRQAVQSVMGKYHIPGAVAGVWSQGAAPWRLAEGFSTIEQKTPITLDSYFSIRSITKSFVVTVILHLVRDGGLSLDQTIDQYVPGIPNGNRMTLAQLAGMESGFEDYSRVNAFLTEFFRDLGRAWTPQQIVDFAIPPSPLFDPGARYDYANTNTVLLGIVIEKVTQLPIDAVLRARIFDRLGLAHTIYPYTLGLPDPHPTPYEINVASGAFDDLPLVNPTAFGAAGAMTSTLDDLGTWGLALGSGMLITPELQQLRMTRSRPATNGPEYDRYGLGIGSFKGWWGHTGSGLGFQAATFYDPTTGTTIAVLVNSTPDINSSPELNFAQEIFAALADVVHDASR